MPQVEVRPYVRSDGVRVEGYVRSGQGEGQAVFSKGKGRTTIAGQWQSANKSFPDGKASARIKKGKVDQASFDIASQVGWAKGAYSQQRGTLQAGSHEIEASVSRGKTGTVIAGKWNPAGVQFNPSASGTIDFDKDSLRRGNLGVDSDLGQANVSYSKDKGLGWSVAPNVMGIAKAVGSFLKNQAEKATEAPGTVADAASQAGQSIRTSSEAIIPTDVSPGVAKAAVGAAVVGGVGMAGTMAAPALLAGAATPSTVSAAATGTALITPPVKVAGLLPATGATVARGGAIALTAAPPPGATTIAKAAIAPTLKKAAQTVVPMVGSQKFKVVDASGKTLMANLTKQQAAKMAGQFGQIL